MQIINTSTVIRPIDRILNEKLSDILNDEIRKYNTNQKIYMPIVAQLYSQLQAPLDSTMTNLKNELIQ